MRSQWAGSRLAFGPDWGAGSKRWTASRQSAVEGPTTSTLRSAPRAFVSRNQFFTGEYRDVMTDTTLATYRLAPTLSSSRSAVAKGRS